MAGITVVFDIAANDCVMARVEHRPRRGGQADAARVEVIKNRAIFDEDVR